MKTLVKIFLSRMTPVVIGFLISAYLTILETNIVGHVRLIIVN